MFEDSTFESAGRIKSKSKYWMIATFVTNGSILVLLILIPLIYPEALPKAAMQMALVAPPPAATSAATSATARGGPRGAGEVGDDEQSAHGSHPHSA